MPLSISTNIASLTAQRSFMNTNAALETAFERLSSGSRVNSAVDGSADLAIGKTLESHVSGLNQAVRNTNDGISMVQIAEGALDEATTILQRMRDLAVQAGNSSLGTAELGYLDAEQAKLATTLGDVLGQATFNGIVLIDTNSDVTLTFQVGADNGDILTFDIDCLTAAKLTVGSGDITLDGAANASTAIDRIDAALAVVYADRADLGAIQAQMESTVRNLANVAENLSLIHI